MAINKRNYKLYAVKKTGSRTAEYGQVATFDSVRFADCSEILERCREMYDKLYELRVKSRRNTNYVQGDQWSDIIEDPYSYFEHGTIRERDYIKREGKVPLQYNIIGKTKDAILGLYRGNQHQPTAIARERDEQKLGEMLTMTLQYAYDTNNIPELNKNLLETAYCKGIVIRGTYFRRNDERLINDVYVENIPLNNVFFNSDVSDPLMRDLRVIGVIRDYTEDELVSAFAAGSESAAEELLREYHNSHNGFYMRTPDYAFSERRNEPLQDFYNPRQSDKCRVFEVWTKETERVYSYHDRATGTIGFRDFNSREKRYMDAVNAKRRDDFRRYGGKEDEAPLIEYEQDVRTYWYFRYITPTGKCLLEGETPFEHRSHPFTIAAFPMVDGEIHSPAEKLIDIQRVINRILTQFDFIRQNSAKGLKMIPITAIPDGMTPREFATEYTRSGGFMFYQPDMQGNIPQIIKTASVSPGDIDILRIYLQLQNEISGVSNAMRGEEAKSGVAASLYRQQAENSSTNIADFLTWFNNVIRQSDYKMMRVIQQYYDSRFYIPIVGTQYSEESRWYSPDKIRNSDFDIVLTETNNTPAFRLAAEETLQMMLQQGVINVKTYLETTSAPFADKMLAVVKRQEEEQAAQQEQEQEKIQQLMGGGQQGGLQLPAAPTNQDLPIGKQSQEQQTLAQIANGNG